MPQYFYSTGKLEQPGGNGGAIEIIGDGSPDGGSFMTFHRPNVYATRFGLDQDNEFAFGGWSAGDSTRYKFWTQANFDPHNLTGTTKVQRLLFGGQMELREAVDPVTGARIDIRRASGDRNDSYGDIIMWKDTRGKPMGEHGKVSTMFSCEQNVGAANAFQWPIVSSLRVWEGGGTAQHVALTGQALKMESAGSTAAAMWAVIPEFRDYTELPQAASISMEVGLHVNGPDPHLVRRAIDVSLGEAFTPGQKANNESDVGVSVANTSGYENHRTRYGFRMEALWKESAFGAFSRENLGTAQGDRRRYAQYATPCSPNYVEMVLQTRRHVAGTGQSDVANEIVHIVDGGEQNRMSMFHDRTEFTKPVSFALPSYTIATLPNPGVFARRMVFVEDGTNGRKLAISAITAWTYGDGTIIQ